MSEYESTVGRTILKAIKRIAILIISKSQSIIAFQTIHIFMIGLYQCITISYVRLIIFLINILFEKDNYVEQRNVKIVRNLMGLFIYILDSSNSSSFPFF